MENHLDISKNFIPYELAVKLKELGFDEDCFGYYGDPLIGKQERFSLRLDWTPESYPFKDELHCLAPLWQQSFDWFREKHNLHCVIDEYENPKSWGYLINNDDLDEDFNFNYYEEARLECLKELIKIAKKKQLE